MAKFIETGKMFDALHAAGVVEDEPSYVRRVIIDLQAGRIGMVYIEKFADDEKLSVALNGGLEIVTGEEA